MSMPKINFGESARFNPALIKKSNEEERGENACRNGAENFCALISKALEPQWCPSLIPPRVSPLGTRVRWLNLSPLVLLSRVLLTAQRVSSWVFALCRIASSSFWREIKVQHYGWKRNHFCLYVNVFFSKISNALCNNWTLKAFHLQNLKTSSR